MANIVNEHRIKHFLMFTGYFLIKFVLIVDIFPIFLSDILQYFEMYSVLVYYRCIIKNFKKSDDFLLRKQEHEE